MLVGSFLLSGGDIPTPVPSRNPGPEPPPKPSRLSTEAIAGVRLSGITGAGRAPPLEGSLMVEAGGEDSDGVLDFPPLLLPDLGTMTDETLTEWLLVSRAVDRPNAPLPKKLTGAILVLPSSRDGAGM